MIKRSFAPVLIHVNIAMFVIVWASSVQACQICIPLPRATLVDRLLESDAVVMAREDSNRPFHYAAVEVLKGEPGQEPIDTFINSQARSVLSADPKYTMILGWDRKDRIWSPLGITRDGQFEAVVRRILEHDTWVPRESSNPARIKEFATLLGHSDRRLHELAYLEVGRAPYSLIKEVSPLVSMESMRIMLNNFQYAQWHSLAILVLGQSDSEIDRDLVYAQLDMSQQFGVSQNLAAWATALIEMDGVEGIRHIEQLYLGSSKPLPEQLEQIILALSTQGKADAKLRDRIADVYRRVMRSNPESAPRFVMDLIAWQRWGFIDEYRELKRDIDPDDALANYAVNLYLSTASRMKVGALH